MKLEIKPCPCGQCNKFIVHPLFHSMNASIDLETAQQIVARWNFFEGDDQFFGLELILDRLREARP